MQLTLYTDYSLRVLLYLGQTPGRSATISEIAEAYQISRNHLVKVVHNLSIHGFIKTTRGCGGGMALQRPPEEIVIGNVVRHTEVNFNLAECFERERNTCQIAAACRLKAVLYEAQHAFINTLDNKTLADILPNNATGNTVEWRLQTSVSTNSTRHKKPVGTTDSNNSPGIGNYRAGNSITQDPIGIAAPTAI